jgi:hypothetical protein
VPRVDVVANNALSGDWMSLDIPVVARLDQSGQRAGRARQEVGHLRITVDVGDDVQLVL